MSQYLNKSFYKFLLGFVAIIAISFTLLSFAKIFDENQVKAEDNPITQ
ncbi:MAG: hypothetical protein WC095_01410 [Candidatus Paceibacterota bacterium]